MPLQFRRIVHGSKEYQAECALRHEVLRVPLGMSLYDENLDVERDYLHFGLFGEAEDLQACLQAVCVSATEAKLRQMAVKPSIQGTGAGRQMICCVEKVLRAGGIQRVILHARSAVLGFYIRCGYAPEGEEFTEVGIPHRKMVKTLLPV